MQGVEVATPGVQPEMILNLPVPKPEVALEGFSRGR